MKNNMVIYSWEEIEELTRIVHEKIIRSNFFPDIIFGIYRSGIVPATHLAYLLKIKNLDGIKVTSNSDETAYAKKTDYTVKSNVTQAIVENRKILLFDSVMASGKTMLYSIEAVKKYNPQIIKTATLIDWPDSPYSDNMIDRPNLDYFATSVDRWPDFPWEH